MIVFKNKVYEQNKLFPKDNFTHYSDEDIYLVDETTEEGKMLAEKIQAHAPYFDFVTEIRQFPIMKEQPIIVIEIDEETGEEVRIGTDEVELVETGEYEEKEILIDVIPLPKPEPEIADDEIDEEKIAMAEAIIDLNMRIEELENRLNGGV